MDNIKTQSPNLDCFLKCSYIEKDKETINEMYAEYLKKMDGKGSSPSSQDKVIFLSSCVAVRDDDNIVYSRKEIQDEAKNLMSFLFKSRLNYDTVVLRIGFDRDVNIYNMDKNLSQPVAPKERYF